MMTSRTRGLRALMIGTTVAALLGPAAAAAATYSYNFANSYFIFTLDSHPTVIVANENGFGVTPPEGGTFFGAPAFLYILSFRSANAGGGLIAHGEGDVTSYGPALYTGPETAPTMRLGTFDLEGNTLVVTNISAVPEPASWTLMIAGFGMTGAALRRREVKAATA